MKPFVPMSPISSDRLPQGEDWAYQLKWDGYRILASLQDGRMQLFSKKMLPQNGKFPELTSALSRIDRSCLIDGEAIVMDPSTGKPSFQKLQQRLKFTLAGRSRPAASERLPVQFIAFDLLELDGRDLRRLPFRERDRMLRELAAKWEPPLFTTDLFHNGPALWEWIEQHGWEGLVSKKLSSAYKEGKEHQDWFKKKALLEFDVEIAGIIWKEGRVSSMVMRENGVYFGRVSSGLNEKLKSWLRSLDTVNGVNPFGALPEGLKGADVRWLVTPVNARVTGSEVTEEGSLRHPKLLNLEGAP
ncbi:DNA ligase [Cohnella kolymensis]|uniref:DNA ligase n=1 Tax=Cohnella kolymensis TaxID=1590652 RepID=A0ABR4ZZ52_9BACL|nr:DNA ligase [Cohnella kolymensis]KIL34127.1 DNA ligase [Cohnella kolymensis]